LIIFELPDSMLTQDQLVDLATKSPIWTLCDEWRVQTGTFEQNVVGPEIPNNINEGDNNEN